MKETLLDFEPFRQRLHMVVVVEVVFVNGFVPKTIKSILERRQLIDYKRCVFEIISVHQNKP